jgi:hypothetical protein
MIYHHTVAQLVKSLCYKPNGRGSFSNKVFGIFPWPYSSGRTVALGLTKSLIEISTKYVSWGLKAAGA